MGKYRARYYTLIELASAGTVPPTAMCGRHQLDAYTAYGIRIDITSNANYLNYYILSTQGKEKSAF